MHNGRRIAGYPGRAIGGGTIEDDIKAGSVWYVDEEPAASSAESEAEAAAPTETWMQRAAAGPPAEAPRIEQRGDSVVIGGVAVPRRAGYQTYL
jgi:hypothetical protein